MFPRTGIPRRFASYAAYVRVVDALVRTGAIPDPSFLWWDARLRPELGTVEVRVMDSQTRVEHSLGLAALVQALVKELGEHFDAGKKLSRFPYEMLDENKFIAARHGLEGEIVDLPKATRVATKQRARRVLKRVREHAEDLGSADDLDCVEDIIDNGNGGARQLIVYEANHDLREVMAEIVEKTTL
jgi:carboxylate-amine ligase